MKSQKNIAGFTVCFHVILRFVQDNSTFTKTKISNTCISLSKYINIGVSVHISIHMLDYLTKKKSSENIQEPFIHLRMCLCVYSSTFHYRLVNV